MSVKKTGPDALDLLNTVMGNCTVEVYIETLVFRGILTGLMPLSYSAASVPGIPRAVAFGWWAIPPTVSDTQRKIYEPCDPSLKEGVEESMFHG
ncbi:MAG: hypothetical protein OS112_01170 [Methanoregula sp.]|nr:MAG: hypothetical protein OS112_01170 [Methanoregula sp.]